MHRFLTIHRLGNVELDQLNLRLRALKGQDALSQLFHYRLAADVRQDQLAELTADQILGQRVIVSIREGELPPVFLSGIVSRMAFGNVTREDRRQIRFEVVPELWKLTETLDTRRHASKTVAQLVAHVLDERRLDLKLVDRVSADPKRHPPRVNPVQYEEPYYQFISRHLIEEGIFFFHRGEFTEDNGEVQGDQTLVLGDETRAYFEPDPPLELRFQAHANMSPFFNVRNWDRQFNFRPGKWTVSDFDYHKATDFSMTRALGSSSQEYRKFKAHAGFYDKDYADHMLSNLAEKEDVDREYILATSDCPYLSPGCRFKLLGHPTKSENGEYIVTSVEHRAIDDLYGENSESEYENRFTCVPSSRVPVSCPHLGSQRADSWPTQGLQGRSAGAAFDDSSSWADFEFDSGTARGAAGVADVPLDTGIVAESALVVDANGNHDDPETEGTVYARRDGDGPLGRAEVLIKYTWETTTNETGKSPWQAPDPDVPGSTRWVRVTQLAAGKDWGTKHIPRVGEEVVVLYLDGAKKKPVIIGSLYNSDYTTTNMNDRETEDVNIVAGQGGSSAFTKTGHYGIATDPGSHKLVEGVSGTPRAVPNLKQDDVSGMRTRAATSESDASYIDEGQRFNEILFKDTKQAEELYMHAARDLNIDVEQDMNIVVKGDVNEIIHGKYYRSVNVDHAEGPVNRSVVGGTSFDLDKVWEYKAVEGSSHPYTVKTEFYADTETRTFGDVKEVHNGTTESYLMGNEWQMNLAASESFTFGFTLDIYVGLKTDIAIAGSLAVYVGGMIEITGAAKLEYTRGASINKSPAKVQLYGLKVDKARTNLASRNVSLNQDKLHVIKGEVIVLDANLIVLKANQIIEKSDTGRFSV